jgi:hypothetical protein
MIAIDNSWHLSRLGRTTVPERTESRLRVDGSVYIYTLNVYIKKA